MSELFEINQDVEFTIRFIIALCVGMALFLSILLNIARFCEAQPCREDNVSIFIASELSTV